MRKTVKMGREKCINSCNNFNKCYILFSIKESQSTNLLGSICLFSYTHILNVILHLHCALPRNSIIFWFLDSREFLNDLFINLNVAFFFLQGSIRVVWWLETVMRFSLLQMNPESFSDYKCLTIIAFISKAKVENLLNIKFSKLPKNKLMMYMR